MQNIIYRQPIHLYADHKGKIIKNSSSSTKYHIKSTQDYSSISINSNLNNDQNNHSPNKIKLKINFFHKKSWKNEIAGSQTLENMSKTERAKRQNENGSYRAIHTSQNIYANRAFPLRTVTPIKPFRRGIHTSRKFNDSNSIPIEQVTNSKMFRNHMRSKIGNNSIIHPPLLIDRQEKFNQGEQKNVEEEQQYFKYNERNKFFKDVNPENRSKNQENQNKKQLKGTKIQPFKRYKIRQMQNIFYNKNRLQGPNILNIELQSDF